MQKVSADYRGQLMADSRYQVEEGSRQKAVISKQQAIRKRILTALDFSSLDLVILVSSESSL